eukprot:3702970-Amphidinium_carterae.3
MSEPPQAHVITCQPWPVACPTLTNSSHMMANVTPLNGSQCCNASDAARQHRPKVRSLQHVIIMHGMSDHNTLPPQQQTARRTQ